MYNNNENIINIKSNEAKFNTYKCPKCGKGYSYTFTLQRHLKYECGKEPGFLCVYCPHRSKRKSNLLEHVKHVHPEKPFNYAENPDIIKKNVQYHKLTY